VEQSPERQEQLPAPSARLQAVPVVPAAAPTAAVGGEQPADDKQLGDYLWNLHKYTNDYVRFADTKAAAILGFCSGLMGVLYLAKNPKRLLSMAPVSWSLGDWALIAAFILLTVALVCVGMAIVPRLEGRQSRGFIYWDSALEHGAADTYWQRLTQHSSRQLNEHLAHHVYSVAAISSAKYRWASRAIRVAMVGASFAAVVLIAT
jgi:hypothetical protein